MKKKTINGDRDGVGREIVFLIGAGAEGQLLLSNGFGGKGMDGNA